MMCFKDALHCMQSNLLLNGSEIPFFMMQEIISVDMDLLLRLNLLPFRKAYFYNRETSTKVLAMGVRFASFLEETTLYSTLPIPLFVLGNSLLDSEPCTFGIPLLLIYQTKEQSWLYAYAAVHEKKQLLKLSTHLCAMPSMLFYKQEKRPSPLEIDHIPTMQQWNTLHKEALEWMAMGKLNKVVLFRRSVLKYRETVSPYELFSCLIQMGFGIYGFYVEVSEQEVFLGYSPELLYCKRNHTLEVDCVAGTRPRGESLEEDKGLYDDLKRSCKDQSEHRIVVDGVLQSLSNLGLRGDVLPQERLLLSHVQHLWTRIKAISSDSISDWVLLNTLHPTPAIVGYPRSQAQDFFRKMPWCSPYFAGPVGYIGSDYSDVAVGIRSALVCGNSAFLMTGAGIVPTSNAAQEWKELDDKMRPWME